MGTILAIHAIFGERVLPLLIVIAAIWFTIAWKPGVPPARAARLFPVLVDIQFLLGLIYWLYGISVGLAGLLSFPFLLHPILGLLSVGIAHMSVRPRGFLSGLGRWAPLASLVVLLISVLLGIYIANMAGQVVQG